MHINLSILYTESIQMSQEKYIKLVTYRKAEILKCITNNQMEDRYRQNGVAMGGRIEDH